MASTKIGEFQGLDVKEGVVSIPLTRISWEHTVTQKLEEWIHQVAKGRYEDLTNTVEDYFEKLLKRPCVAVSSGTAALHLALRMLQLKPGSEVIIPTLTYAACANVVLYEELNPIFCDVNPETWCLDAEILEEILETKRKSGATVGAVMPVHLYGQSCNMTEINKICKKYDVSIIEDVAQAFGGKCTRSKSLGSIGTYSCFSFNANKLITGMGGGLIGLQNISEKKYIRNLIRHGRIPFEPGFAEYNHNSVGFNYQISGYSAALVYFQLPYTEERLRKKQEIFDRYKNAFGEIGSLKPQSQAVINNHSRWMSCFELQDTLTVKCTREKLCRLAAQYGIEVRPVFKPLHMQKVFKQNCISEFPNAEHISDTGICLPSSCDLDEKEQERIVLGLKNCLRK